MMMMTMMIIIIIILIKTIIIMTCSFFADVRRKLSSKGKKFECMEVTARTPSKFTDTD